MLRSVSASRWRQSHVGISLTAVAAAVVAAAEVGGGGGHFSAKAFASDNPGS